MSEQNSNIDVQDSAAASTLIPVEATLQPGLVVDSCKRCSRAFGIGGLKRSPSMRDYCVECAKSERKEMTVAKNDNSNWLQLALEQGIPLWEQQPGESSSEFDLWCIYRDLWPDVRPTVTKVARTAGLSTKVVQRAFTRWTWAARLQAWIREVNADRTAELRAERRAMVEDHIKLGQMMRTKMMIAVEQLDPEDVTPGELVQLLKETQRLEQTGREALDAVEVETAQDIDNMPAGLFEEEDSGDGRKGAGNSSGLSLEDMAEVVGILSQAGVIQVNGSRVGVKKSTTTEVVVVNDEL